MKLSQYQTRLEAATETLSTIANDFGREEDVPRVIKNRLVEHLNDAMVNISSAKDLLET